MFSPYDQKKLNQAITYSGMDDDINQMINGLNTVVGHGGARLTEAQRIRLALARAIYQDCQTIIMDECLAILIADDQESASFIIRELLTGLWKSKTLIVVSDNSELARNSDQILYFNNGEILKQGPVEDFSEFFDQIFTDHQRNISPSKMVKLREEVDVDEFRQSIRPLQFMAEGNQIIEDMMESYDSRFETVIAGDDSELGDPLLMGEENDEKFQMGINLLRKVKLDMLIFLKKGLLNHLIFRL